MGIASRFLFEHRVHYEYEKAVLWSEVSQYFFSSTLKHHYDANPCNFGLGMVQKKITS